MGVEPKTTVSYSAELLLRHRKDANSIIWQHSPFQPYNVPIFHFSVTNMASVSCVRDIESKGCNATFTIKLYAECTPSYSTPQFYKQQRYAESLGNTSRPPSSRMPFHRISTHQLPCYPIVKVKALLCEQLKKCSGKGKYIVNQEIR